MSCWLCLQGGFVNGPLEACVTRQTFCSSAVCLLRVNSSWGDELVWGVGSGRVNTSSVDESETYQRKEIHLELDIE